MSNFMFVQLTFRLLHCELISVVEKFGPGLSGAF